MKRFLIFILLIQINITLKGQKKVMDFPDILDWPSINDVNISGNGEYIAYIKSGKKQGDHLIIQSTSTAWEKEYSFHAYDLSFSNDSRFLIFSKQKDTLGVIELGTDSVKYIDNVGSYKVINESRYSLIFQYTNPGRSIGIFNLESNEIKLFQNVDKYQLSGDGKMLVLSLGGLADKSVNNELKYLDLEMNECKTIGRGYITENIVIRGNQIALLTQERMNENEGREVRYYKIGMDSATVLIDCKSWTMEDLEIDQDGSVLNIANDSYFSVPGFNRDGTKLFFLVKKKKHSQNKATTQDISNNVTIWKSDDIILSHQDKEEESLEQSLLAVLNLQEPKHPIVLQKPDDASINLGENAEFALAICNDGKNTYESAISYRQNFHFVSEEDGTRKLLKGGLISPSPKSSPSGKYIIWYDRKERHWFTYSITKQRINNISRMIPTSLFEDRDIPDLPGPEGIAGWLDEDEAVLIYDSFDIWKVDPEGVKRPVCITHQSGLKQHIRFRVVNFNKDISESIQSSDTLILSAFNISTKENGFFNLTLDKNGKLDKLILDDRSYYFPRRYSRSISGEAETFLPLKAKKTNAYIVKIMSADKYPNLYLTKDFKKYKQLTFLTPEKEFVWYKSELVHWKIPNGIEAEGLLYKPENFNPKKKYPILFYVYEKNADALNSYISPQLSSGVINIPLFVSNNYLVFVPDIYYKEGYPGESAYNSVTSAAKYLTRFPWIDSKKMGIQGHSFGGFETNYIISHTDLFAAAGSASGISNLTSDYGELLGTRDKQFLYEKRQGRMGGTLWTRPQQYILNSSLFNAEKVNTPLLLMHNTEDRIVNWSQGAQWFMALRRLGKKVWFLQYKNEGHRIDGEENQLDYTRRMMAFFNVYLKGYPLESWMIK